MIKEQWRVASTAFVDVYMASGDGFTVLLHQSAIAPNPVVEMIHSCRGVA